ncbi:hypothetical protein HanRHA438_Chr04g0171091 [Helianthus annuus]|nr:hypothetical protein HanRHA438_Chr04g0171091 [Helianthus annuus]
MQLQFSCDPPHPSQAITETVFVISNFFIFEERASIWACKEVLSSTLWAPGAIDLFPRGVYH